MYNRRKASDKYAARTSLRSPVQTMRLGAAAAAALIAAAICIAYFPALNGAFILDDDKLLTANRQIRDPDGPYQFWLTAKAYDYWPVSNCSLWMEWRLWEMYPAGYHVTNLVLHLAASLLIWLVLRKLTIPGALLAALIFAVHPVNVESAAWIAQRKDDLAIVFFLLSVFWYFKADAFATISQAADARSHGGPWERDNPSFNKQQDSAHCPLPTAHYSIWYWLSLLAFTLGMLSKGSIAVLPLILLGIAWWRQPRETDPIFAGGVAGLWSAKLGLSPYIRRHIASIAPFFLVAAALAAVNVWFQTHMGGAIRDVSFTVRLLGAGAVAWFYLYKAFFPLNLIFIYPMWKIDPGDFRWWLPLACTVIVTVVLWIYRKGWSRPILFAWGFFCAALVPVMGFTDVGFMMHSLVADHYQHIAIIGVIALAAAGWNAWRRQLPDAFRATAYAAAAIAVVSLGLLTRLQNEMYRDTAKLYRLTLDKNPGCWLIHNNLGIILADQNRYQEAIAEYNKTLESNPKYAEAHNNLGNALGHLGQWQEAIDCYHEALKHSPENPQTLNNLAYALGSLRRYTEAVEIYQQAIKIHPYLAGIRDNMAFTLVEMNKAADAVDQYKIAIDLEPKNPQFHSHFAFALIKAGRLTEAIEQCREALRLAPGYPEARANLALALANADRYPEAIAEYMQYLRYKPDSTEAYCNLSLLYSRMRQFSQAEAAARRAMELARSQGQTALAKQAEELLNGINAKNPDGKRPSPASN
jgi:tetratricopeptide (TPR) repeat protein